MTVICEVHPTGMHTPASTEDQDHHVVPRHWQQVWMPTTAPFPGTFKEFGVVQALWDARTIKVPPTCHRNVHTRIVQVMRQLDATFGRQIHLITADDITAAGKAVSKANKLRTTMALQELQWALEAPLRFLAAGGAIADLLRVKTWGEA